MSDTTSMTDATTKTTKTRARKEAPAPEVTSEKYAVTFVNKAGIETTKHFDSRDKAFGFKAGLASCDVTGSITNLNKKSKTAKSK